MARFNFGQRSTANLRTCHPDLQDVALEVMSLQLVDFAIIWGFRNEEQQMQAFMSGNSKKRWPESKHNNTDATGNPFSLALDFAPWIKMPDGSMGIPWNDTHAFAMIGGMFLACGAQLGTTLRYGGDWNMNGSTKDQTLMDWGHVELRR